MNFEVRKHFPRSPVVFFFRGKSLLLSLLTLCVLGTAMAVIYHQHLNRSLHAKLQGLQQSRDRLHVEWSRLLLEQGTLGSDVRVEQVARDQLDMTVPKPDEMWVMRP